jgi:hypothetical protein
MPDLDSALEAGDPLTVYCLKKMCKLASLQPLWQLKTTRTLACLADALFPSESLDDRDAADFAGEPLPPEAKKEASVGMFPLGQQFLSRWAPLLILPRRTRRALLAAEVPGIQMLDPAIARVLLKDLVKGIAGMGAMPGVQAASTSSFPSSVLAHHGPTLCINPPPKHQSVSHSQQQLQHTTVSAPHPASSHLFNLPIATGKGPKLLPGCPLPSPLEAAHLLGYCCSDFQASFQAPQTGTGAQASPEAAPHSSPHAMAIQGVSSVLNHLTGFYHALVWQPPPHLPDPFAGALRDSNGFSNHASASSSSFDIGSDEMAQVASAVLGADSRGAGSDTHQGGDFFVPPGQWSTSPAASSSRYLLDSKKLQDYLGLPVPTAAGEYGK